MGKVKTERKDTFIMGDFNIDLLDPQNKFTSEWKETIKLLGLKSLIKDPTRFSTQRNSCLDNILSNSNQCHMSGVLNINLSDHEAIYAVHEKMKAKSPQSDFYGRSYRNFVDNLFHEKLNTCDWTGYMQAVNISQKWKLYINNIEKVIDDMCPLKFFKTKAIRDPWITDELIEMIKDKDRALKRAKRTNDPECWRIARRLRNDCLKYTRNAKAEFVKSELNENAGDSKKFWKNINSILKPDISKTTNSDLVDQFNRQQVRFEDTANFINEYFAHIGPNLARQFSYPWTPIDKALHDNMPDIMVDAVEVEKLCRAINISKSSSLKNISSKVVTNTVPDSWKIATIIPIPKEGNSQDVNNLRPISLLPIQGKLLEKVVNDRLTEYLEENGIIDGNQGGFRAGHSTIDTAVRFTEDIYKGMNNKLFTVAIFIDMRKASVNGWKIIWLTDSNVPR